MATLYTGEQFWTDTAWEVTAISRAGQYSDRIEFIEAVNSWMGKHNIKSKWSGESTHTKDGVITYHYHVKIVDQKERTFFALRWA